MPNKLHLHQLPEMSPENQISAYPGKSKKCIMLFPLYSDMKNVDLLYAYTRGAIWSRYSWLKFTDAIDLDIKIGFYVDKEAIDRIIPIFEKFGINRSTDIFLFNASSIRLRWYRKLLIFNDQQFADYEWVILVDSDNFMACKLQRKMPFFEYVIQRPIEKCLGVLGFKIYSKDMRSQRISEFYDKVSGIYPEPDYEKQFCRILGELYMYPAKFMHNNHPEDCRWIEEAAEIVGIDEIVFEIWWHLNKSNKVFRLAEEINIKSYRNRMPTEKERENPYLIHIIGKKIKIPLEDIICTR